MASTILIRLGGLVAMVCGAASATLGLLYILEARGLTLDPTEKALQKGHYENPTLNLLVLGVLAAIAALHIAQRRHYGRWGALVSGAAFAGLAMTAGGGLLGGFVPALAGQAMLLMLVGVLVASASVVGLGIRTLTAKVLPRWCGVAVVVGSPPFVFLAFMAVGFLESGLASAGLPSETSGGMGWGVLWALPGLSWALVGYAVFRAGAYRSEQPSRVR